MPYAKANKLIPVVDGTAGTPIMLQDARISDDNVSDGDILVYNGADNVFEPAQFPVQNNTLPTAQCTTQASSGLKYASCSDFSLKNSSYLVINIKYANTYNGKITLDVHHTGEKDVWINGAVSSSSNKTLPAGMYIAYYDGSKYLFRTDGKLPIAGGAFGGDYNDLTNKPTIPTVDEYISETSTNPVQNKAVGKELRKLYDSVDVVERLGSEYADNELFISTQTGIWTVSETSMYKHWIVPIDGIRKVTIVANSSVAQHYTLFASYSAPAAGNTPDYATGYTNVVRVAEGTSRDIVIPADAKYLYLNTGNNGAAKAAHVYLTGVGITEHTGDGTGFVKDDGTVDNTEYQQALPDIADNGGKVLAVTSAGDDLEWVPQSGGTTLPAYTGNAGKKLAVNTAEDGVEWVSDTGGYNFDAGIDLEMAQSYVPDGYKEQTYVYNSSSTRLNTGVTLSEDDVVMEIKVRPSTGSWYIFQSRNSSNQVAGISGASSGAKINANFCGTTVTSNITRTTSHWYVVRMTAKNGVLTLYVKDETAGTEDTVTGTYTYTSQTLSVYIWGNNQGNTVSQNNRVEYAIIKVGGKKLMHYIPAVRMSDSEAGFYDLVSKSFKETTSGTANAGGDATAHNVLNFTNDTGYAILPEHTSADAEKVLSIDSTGEYEWRALGQGGQVNADWNATSGVAQILNKPTIPSLPKELGIAYATCTDDIENNPESFSINTPSGYELKDGGLLVVRFANPVPYNMSVEISGVSMKIYYRNAIMGNGVINGGTCVLLQTNYIQSSWRCDLISSDFQYFNFGYGECAKDQTLRNLFNVQMRENFILKDGVVVVLKCVDNITSNAVFVFNGVQVAVMYKGAAINDNIIYAGNTELFVIQENTSGQSTSFTCTLVRYIPTLAELRDTDISSIMANGQLLQYSGTSGKWMNSTFPIMWNDVRRTVEEGTPLVINLNNEFGRYDSEVLTSTGAGQPLQMVCLKLHNYGNYYPNIVFFVNEGDQVYFNHDAQFSFRDGYPYKLVKCIREMRSAQSYYYWIEIMEFDYAGYDNTHVNYISSN